MLDQRGYHLPAIHVCQALELLKKSAPACPFPVTRLR